MSGDAAVCVAAVGTTNSVTRLGAANRNHPVRRAVRDARLFLHTEVSALPRVETGDKINTAQHTKTTLYAPQHTLMGQENMHKETIVSL